MLARLIASLILIIVHHQQVDSTAIEVARNELDSKAGFLGASFAKSIAEIFYDKAESAELAENYPMLAMLTEMARMHVSQHKREQDALLVASEIVDRYFVKSKLAMYDSLPKTKSLVDLIVCRIIQHACESEFAAEHNRRKRIYSLLKEHDQVTGVRELAREHSMRIQDKKARAIKSKRRMEEALRKYQSDISDNPRSAFDTMKSVDELIALTKLSRPRDFRSEANIGQSPIMVDLTVIERKLSGKVNRLSNFAVELIPIEEVVAYERAQVRSHLDLMRLVIDVRRSEMDKLLEQNIDELFYKPRQVLDKSASNYYPMLALSAELAEAEAMLYTFQMRMLKIADNIVKQYFIDKTSALNETLVENRHLLNTILLRAEACALDAGIMRIEDQRKKLFLLMRAYDYDGDMVRLARKFYVDLNQQQHRLAQVTVEASSFQKRYQYDVSLVLSASQLSDTETQIDNLLHGAIQQDYSAMTRESSTPDIELDYLLEKFVGANLVQAIRLTEEKVAGKVKQLDQKEIQSVEPQLVVAFEKDIINM